MTLLFSVRNQSLTLSTNQQRLTVAADSKNYLKAKFNFCTKDWSDGIKYALFTHNNKTYKKILGAEDGVDTNECYVPPEVIKQGKMIISIFSGDRITTNTVEINVDASGYTENIENEKTTPTVMEQMNNLMYKYASLCNDIHKECVIILKEIKGGDE